MLRRAQERRRISSALRCDAARVPLQSNSVDAVVMTNVLHVHPSPQLVLAEAIRIVQPGGLLVASWPVDGITATRMHAIDRQHNRSLRSSLAASVLRIGVGLAASFTTVGRARRPGRSMNLRHHFTAAGLSLLREPQIIADCQELIVARKDTRAPRSTLEWV